MTNFRLKKFKHTKNRNQSAPFCIRQFLWSEMYQRNRRQWNSGSFLEKFLTPSGPQVESRSILGADGFGNLLTRNKEIVERPGQY